MERIRALKSELGQTPALALTAYAGPEDVQHTHLAGFHSHMANTWIKNLRNLHVRRLKSQVMSIRRYGNGKMLM